MTTPSNLTFVDQTTVILTSWLQGINDWVFGAFGVFGSTYTATAFRSALGITVKEFVEAVPSNITLVDIATSYSNLCDAATLTIPTKGIIKFNFSGRITETGGTQLLSAYFGIRVNSVNYWFAQQNVNGVITNSPLMTTNPSTYRETAGPLQPGSVQMNSTIINIAAAGIATGAQTIQPIVAKAAAGAGTVTGLTTASRVTLEIVSSL